QVEYAPKLAFRFRPESGSIKRNAQVAVLRNSAFRRRLVASVAATNTLYQAGAEQSEDGFRHIELTEPGAFDHRLQIGCAVQQRYHATLRLTHGIRSAGNARSICLENEVEPGHFLFNDGPFVDAPRTFE